MGKKGSSGSGSGQSERQMSLVRIPPDVNEGDLLPWKLTGHEEIGRSFRYELLLLSKLTGFERGALIGHDVTVLIEIPGADRGRHVNGFVSSFESMGKAGDYFLFKAVLRPWTWILSNHRSSRIFQDKSAIEILKAICGGDRYKEYSFDYDESRLSNDVCRKRSYCVQYQESDFDFISRLLEEEGIYYYFAHDEKKHSMVLCCEPASHGPFFGQPLEAGDSLYYAREGNNVERWTAREEVTPESFRHRDYDFQNPGTYVDSQAADPDVYEYPGRCAEPVFDTQDRSTLAGDLAKVRLEELKALATVIDGETTVARWLAPGHKFEMMDHPDSAQNREYLVVGSDMLFEGDDYGAQAGGSEDGPAGYRCSFSAVPADTQFRPARVTAKPHLSSLQTATVVGADGSMTDKGKVVADKVGRVYLRFHWDLEAHAKEAGGDGEYHHCPARVAQPWAGCAFGALFMPRVGHEVLVAFMDGDPDRPLVVSSVYNSVNPPPYDPASMPTVSAIQSRSIDTTDAFNEILLDDKKDAELLSIQAQKNMSILVKNDRRELVMNNSHLAVKKDKFEHVEHNRNEAVDADHMEDIGKDRHLKIKGKEAKEVGGSLSLTVKGDVIEVFKGKHSEETTDDIYLKAKNVIIEGMQNITLSVGGSYVAIEPSGIEIHSGGTLKIDGVQVEVKGSASAKVEGAQIEVKGSAMASIDGGGMTEIKGGIVKIN